MTNPASSASAVADFSETRRNMDDNRELFDEIVKLFLVDAPLRLGRLREAIEQGNRVAVKHEAHAIKGMVGIFAAPRAMLAAGALESLAQQASGELSADELGLALGELETAVINYIW